MIASYKRNPVICFREFISTTIIDTLVEAWSIKTKTTISCNNDKCISHFVLHAALIYKLGEISMDITTHHDALCSRKIEKTYIFHIGTNVYKNLEL